MINDVMRTSYHKTMKSVAAANSGIASTLVMTLVMYHPPFTSPPKVDILRILGKLFTPLDHWAVVLGTLLHLGSGAVFAKSYAWLWHKGVGKVSLPWGFAFGAAHGLLASVLMKYLLGVHPRPPQSWKLSNTVVYIASHVVFGTAVAALYRPQHSAVKHWLDTGSSLAALMINRVMKLKE